MLLSLTFAESMSEGFTTFVIGLGIVFLVLTLLIFIIKLMEVFAREKKTTQAPAVKSMPDPVPEIVMVPAQEEEDEEELVAVLAAAVAAISQREGTRMKIRSYRRAGGQAPAWSRAGRAESLE